MGLTASSLTFTTMIALVPLFTVVLAVFTAFPMFSKMQGVLQQWLVESLIPDNIARNVLGYLTQFASKASRLGALGLALLLVSALALILTIDRTLNNIWRVKRPRSFAQRVLGVLGGDHAGAVAAGGQLDDYFVCGVCLAGGGGCDAGRREVFAGQFAVCHAVWRHGSAVSLCAQHPCEVGARLGGWVFVALGFEAAKKLLAIYLAGVPTYSAVYGAFATAPILLLWIYIAWVIVLLGAVIAAYLPSLLQGVTRRSGGPGWPFQLAIEVLQQLHGVRGDTVKGLSLASLTARLRVDDLQLEAPVEALLKLDWIGQLETTTGEPARYVLLANPDTTELMPLVNALLLRPAVSLNFMRQKGLQPNGILREAL